jgi:hypothetical protein
MTICQFLRFGILLERIRNEEGEKKEKN